MKKTKLKKMFLKKYNPNRNEKEIKINIVNCK